MKILDETVSQCPECLEPIPAKIVEERGKAYLIKEHCGKKDKVFLDNDAELYQNTFLSYGKKFSNMDEVKKLDGNCMQLYVTFDCNLNCPICFNKFAYADYVQTANLQGILNAMKEVHPYLVILSGGEPTTLPNLPEIIKGIKQTGVPQVNLTTNGKKLADIEYCKELKRAGLNEVHLSFDGFDDDLYLKYRGEKLLDLKMEILKNLKEVGITTYLMTVVSKDNLKDIQEVVDFAGRHTDFIECVWLGCLYDANSKNSDKMTKTEIMKEIKRVYGIDEEYFIQSKRMKGNIYNLLGRFTNVKENNNDLFYNIFSFKYNGTLQPFYSMEKVREINKGLEGDAISFVKSIPTLFKMGLIYIANRNFPELNNKYLHSQKYLGIWLGMIETPINKDFRRTSTMAVVLNNKLGVEVVSQKFTESGMFNIT